MTALAAPRTSRFARMKAAVARAALAWGAFHAALSFPSTTLAEPAGDAAPVLLVIEGDAADLDPQEVRRAIEREIGSPVGLAALAPPGGPVLVLRLEHDRRADLTFRDLSGRTIHRLIDLPWESERAVDTVALLAGNLVRDEAREIAELLRKQKPPSEPEPPLPPPPVAKASAAPSRQAAVPPRPKPPAPAKPAPAAPAPCKSSRYPTTLAGIGVDPFGMLAGRSFDHSVRRLSFNVTVGRSAGLAGFEFGILGNYQREFACGVQVATVGSVVGGPVRGVQMAGVFNTSSSLSGAQMAGILNVNVGHAYGAQLGGVNVNLDGPVRGVQMAGVMNWAGEVAGAQIGTLNVATTLAGFQLGVVNVATTKLRGTQIGFVNYADSSDFSLGVINIFPRGRIHLDVWGNESGLIAGGAKHGGKYFHYIYGAAVRPIGDSPRGALVWGIGGHIPIAKPIFTDVDAIGYWFWGRDPTTSLAQLRWVLGWQIVRRFGIYAGPVYNVSTARQVNEGDWSLFGSQLLDQGRGLTVRGWVGVTAGIQVL